MPRLQLCLCCAFGVLSGSIAPAYAEEPTREAVAEALGRMVLERDTTMTEVHQFVEPLIPRMPEIETRDDWQTAADQIRAEVLDRVVFRGEAASWRDAECRVEWLDTIEGGPGYRIRKLRYEALPGFWIPALLYEPEQCEGLVPVVLNVNGHDAAGKAAPYKQERCINLAKRGMLALNVEWIGMGQLRGDGNKHGLINAIDLCGSGGIATHYLGMCRALDLLLDHPNADPERVGLTGLSGGGWQTIFYSALDPRITLSNPVAGYSSFLTRIEYLSDLGDSEQTPCDLATVADYTHLTALLAPRPTLLTFNQKDNCCFAAPHALPPLVGAVAPIYSLFDREASLRLQVNVSPGTHNYEVDNRQALYRMIGDHWFPDEPDYDATEIPSTDEVKTADELHVPLPEDSLDLQRLALDLAALLPRDPGIPDDPNVLNTWREERRNLLRALVRPIEGETVVDRVSDGSREALVATTYRVRLADSWTLPAVRLEPADAENVDGTVLLLADGGRTEAVDAALALLAENKRVVAIDPFFFGESRPTQRDYLWALMIATTGERPLGVQVGQILAAARAIRSATEGEAPSIMAVGPRSSAVSLIAAALGPDLIAEVSLDGALTSLKEILEEGRTYEQSPELFTFGLLEAFDLPQIEALVTPRPIHRATSED
ncbi:alpha/beta hydrolase family protein [Tautonia rosea]|uniref:alpha/beta hydrolase family protein n=1 Tax=Tautonia rosea TaxID=2728037 RepID=UPI001473F173|nr:acetylxylan esterase [Tautonia rosea]